MKPPNINPEIFNKHKIKLAYLFGSRAKGTFTKDSDYDIAVLFKKKNGIRGFLAESAHLKDELREFFPKELDIIALNNAGSLLKYEAISKGLPLFSEDEKFRIDFEVLTVKEYIDDQYMRDIYTNALARRLHKTKAS
jgi:predicted nucleotidyltransferase